MSEKSPDPMDRPGREPDAHGEAQSDEDLDHLKRVQRARRIAAAKAITIAGILILLLVFVLQNAQEVEVDFVFATRRPALIWVMVACIGLGGIVGYLIGKPGRTMRFHGDDRDENGKKR